MASTASLLRSPLPRRRFAACLSTLEASQSSGGATSAGTSCATAKPPSPPPHPPPAARPDSAGKSWADHPDYRRWKDKAEEILKDIDPITLLTKDIWMENVYVLTVGKKLLRSFSIIIHVQKIKLDVGLLLSWLIVIQHSEYQDVFLLYRPIVAG